MRTLYDLFLLFFKVQFFLKKEKKWVSRVFPSFLPIEKAFRRAYRFHNPYRICKHYLQKQRESFVDGYGETPLFVCEQIASLCALKSTDYLIDLGSGRGRGAFFLSQLTGCRVKGYDWVPFFIDTARAIATQFLLPVTFECCNILEADLTGATVIYLYGTCLPDPVIQALICRFETLPSSTQIITVSYPLSDYSPRFQTHKQSTVIFPWGEAEVFVAKLQPIS